MADSCVKHRLSLSQGRRKSGSASPTSRTRPTSPSTYDEDSKALQSSHKYLQFLDLPDGVIDIDDNEDDYGSDMFAYLREREELFVVEEDYLDQNSVSPEMRSVLVDWLLQVGEAIVVFDLLRSFPSQVQHYLKLSQETLYLCISLLDTILDKRDVEADKLQLVGVLPLLILSTDAMCAIFICLVGIQLRWELRRCMWPASARNIILQN